MSAASSEVHHGHPLFPCEDGKPGPRKLHFLSFRRRRSDGTVDNCPKDVPAGEINSWADVIGPWGGGEYKVIGKDENHRIVAWYPAEKGEWLLFDQPSRPFTCPRKTTHNREENPSSSAARPAPASSDMNPLLLALFNQSAEMNRMLLTALLATLENNKGPSFVDALRALKELQPNPLDWLRAAKEMVPAAAPTAAPPTLADQVNAVKELLDLLRPAPVTPQPSFANELKDFLALLRETDAPAEVSEPASQPTPARQMYLPGIGVVEVLQPDPHRLEDGPASWVALESEPVPWTEERAPRVPRRRRPVHRLHRGVHQRRRAEERRSATPPLVASAQESVEPLPMPLHAAPTSMASDPIVDLHEVKRDPRAMAMRRALDLDEQLAGRSCEEPHSSRPTADAPSTSRGPVDFSAHPIAVVPGPCGAANDVHPDDREELGGRGRRRSPPGGCRPPTWAGGCVSA
jgi:hypothetical protein